MQKKLTILWIVLFAVAVIRIVQYSWVADDFFITLRYADHVVSGDGPVYNVGERTEGYTHLLWFVLVTAARTLDIDGVFLGKFLGLPFFIGSMIMLTRISGKLFPRGGLLGFPVATLAWSVHEDALLHTSGGLETLAFVFFLLLAFEALLLPRPRASSRAAAWTLACATLSRPEGMLFSGLAVLWLAWRRGRRRLLEFLFFWSALVAPLFLFRLAYYHALLPNTYYAKSGGDAYWSQGIHYFESYFGSYFVLGLAGLAMVPAIRELRQGSDYLSRHTNLSLLAAFIAATVSMLYVTRLGGDYMFARFFLPATPFLLLLCESLVQRLPTRRLTAFGAVALVALTWGGAA